MGAEEVNDKTGKMKRQQRTLHCRKCEVEGHNTTTCKSDEAGGQIGVAAEGCDEKTKKDTPLQEIWSGRTYNSATCKRGVAAGSQSGVASKKQVSTNRAIRKKVSTKKGNNSGNSVQKSNVEANTEIELAPPRVPPVTPNADEGGSSDVATQESHITTKSWLAPTPTPCMQGPSMDQQLHMGNTNLQPRVLMRAPPPFTSGHFVNMSLLTLQPETVKRIFVDEGGHKFMELSSQATDKGKKKVN
ncbi:hypothetical protein ACS0TY_011457 [Phlomoides rotata]